MQNTSDLLESLGQYEDLCRTLVLAGKLQELEKPMRKWEELLKKAADKLDHIPEYHYFVVVFEQLNGTLYQNTGQVKQMMHHFIRGKDAAERLISLLTLNVSAENSTDTEKLMVLNCGEFERTASFALQTVDSAAAWEMLERAVFLYDWLWPVLQDSFAETAIELHLQLYSLATTLGKEQPGSVDYVKQAVTKYEELYSRTGNMKYLCKGKQAQLSALLQQVKLTDTGYKKIWDFLDSCGELKLEVERQANAIECRIRIQLLYSMAYAALGAEASDKGIKQEAEDLFQQGILQLQSGMSLLQDFSEKVDDVLQQELTGTYLIQNSLLARYYYQSGQNEKAKCLYQKLLKKMELYTKEIQPLSLEICKAQLYTDLAHIALDENVDAAETDFYFSKAALSSMKIVQATQRPQDLYIAATNFLCVAYYKQDKPDEAAKFAQNGLEVCSMLETMQSAEFTQKEIHSMKQQFEKIISKRKKPAFLSRIFGKK